MYLLCFRHRLKLLSCVPPEFKDLFCRVEGFFFWEEIANPLFLERASHGLSKEAQAVPSLRKIRVLRGIG